jgi:hypothetical protein
MNSFVERLIIYYSFRDVITKLAHYWVLRKLHASVYGKVGSLYGQANVIRSHISVSGIQVHTGAPLPFYVPESSEVTTDK